jgi:hypothetical protein
MPWSSWQSQPQWRLSRRGTTYMILIDAHVTRTLASVAIDAPE